MDTSENNKRIAKNTLFLYFRQILVMVVSLYTVRVVLDALGEEDYGIYNAVGGFVSMFNILSGALSVAIGRFITYEMGQPDVTTLRLQRIFADTGSYGAYHLPTDRLVWGMVCGAKDGDTR